MVRTAAIVGLLVVLLAAESTYGAITCPTYTCVTTGQKCGSVSDDSVVIGTCISDHTYCNSTALEPTGMCFALKANGADCSLSTECQSGYCSSSVCTALKLTYNQACTDNSNCLSDICTSGKCAYVPIGNSCSGFSVSQCAKGGYCNAGTCTAVYTAGTSCSYGFQCGLLDCIPTSASGDMKCGKRFSVASGGFCMQTSHCADGFGCLMSTDGTSGTCYNFKGSSLTACNETADCTADHEVCGCNYGTATARCEKGGANTASGSSTNYNTWYNCVTSKCNDDFSTGCIFSKCASQYCSYIKGMYADHSDWNERYPTCYTNWYLANLQNGLLPSSCGGDDSTDSASALVAGNLVLLFVVAVAMLF